MILNESAASVIPANPAHAPIAWLAFRREHNGINSGSSLADHASGRCQGREKVWELVDGGSALSSGLRLFLRTKFTLKLSAFGLIRLYAEP